MTGDGLNAEAEDALAEINVTPMIDVMLVLLIVFMVAAPLATVDVPVSLPQSGATAQPRPDPIWLTVRPDGGVFLGNVVVGADLAAALTQAAAGKTDAVIHLQADRAANYGQVMQVLDQVRAAGFQNIALVAQATAGDGAP